ncbi:PP2C family protein-serine/threonine phosphatase, partial [Actinophytocola sp.]|uniref:PP2C family protein-serine/threonine phosphatase n=1 Tax=Actinophytocola sp. TaxID=1872138 RepID=UPI003D6A5019
QRPLDLAVPAGDLLNVMAEAGRRAGSAVRDLMAADPDPDGGTTLTAMLWSGSQLGLVHIGDSRAYLLRDDELFRITHDHTVVQAMVDEGKLTEDEVATHPQRMLLLHALGTGVEPDVQLRDVRAGDRYLLCSDGLHRVLRDATLREVLGSVAEPEDAVGHLVELANQEGGPDNVSCVIVDIEQR